jgi:hypothetical protein
MCVGAREDALQADPNVGRLPARAPRRPASQIYCTTNETFIRYKLQYYQGSLHWPSPQPGMAAAQPRGPRMSAIRGLVARNWARRSTPQAFAAATLAAIEQQIAAAPHGGSPSADQNSEDRTSLGP